MALYIAVTILALFAAGHIVRPVNGQDALHLSRRAYLSRTCMLLLFLVLFLPEALRVNTGNDYNRYMEFMHLVNSNAYVPTEIGFNTLVKALFALSGFENYILVFAVFAALTIGFFLLAIYEQAEDFFFSFALFMLFGYYFQSYNTVRYYLALAMVTWASRFLVERRYVPFLATVAAAAAFHKSVLVVLLLYPLAVIPWKKWIYAAGAVLCGSFLLLPDFWLRVVVRLYPSYENTPYLEGSSFSLVNIARCVLVLALAFYAGRVGKNAGEDRPAGRNTDSASAAAGEEAAGKRRERFWLHQCLMALAIYLTCSFLPFVSRIGYYLTVSQIFFVPALIRALPEKSAVLPGGKRIMVRRVIRAAAFAAALLFFVSFLRRMSSPTVQILPYRSWVFTERLTTMTEMND